MPKLSIITINYNNLDGLKRTVESVINQTWHEFEYIVIDGGSLDGSASYIESQSKHMDYWISEPDKGIYNAMNKGIAKATGEYMLFLNSGDHLNDSSVLEKNNIYLKEKDLVYFNIKEIRGNSMWIKKCPKEITFSYLFRFTIPHQSTFIRKSLFERMGMYDENLKIVSDWKFFILAFSKYNATYCHVDDDFSTYYLDGISTHEHNLSQMLAEREYVFDSEFPIFKNETNEYLKIKFTIGNLKNSKKMKWLIKLGFLNDF